jgi:glycerophosphoryl diester phosphodiesterase
VRARRCLPQTPVGLLALPGWLGALSRSWLGRLVHYDALHPALPDVSPAMVETVHRHGGRINVYTVNQAQEIRRLAQWGVDGIITDDPLLARRVLSVASRFG